MQSLVIVISLPCLWEVAGGDFADGVIAHEGARLGGEIFVSFEPSRCCSLGGAEREDADPGLNPVKYALVLKATHGFSTRTPPQQTALYRVCNHHLLRQGNCGDITVSSCNRQALTACIGAQLTINGSRCLIQRQDASGKER